jgi:hypothetical protein
MTGRPKANIDWGKVDKYLQAGAEGTTIAEALGVCADTIYRDCEATHKMTFAAYKQQKRAVGLDNLRVKQYQVAMSGDKALLIWLGKQYLGQSDRNDVTTQGERLNTPTFVINNEKSAEAMKKALGLDT